MTTFPVVRKYKLSQLSIISYIKITSTQFFQITRVHVLKLLLIQISEVVLKLVTLHMFGAQHVYKNTKNCYKITNKLGMFSLILQNGLTFTL